MKKTDICLLLVLLLSLCACSSARAGSVTFYYPREALSYNHPDGVIASETRNTSGHTMDGPYLLSLYLMGPMSQKLAPAFPESTQLISCAQSGKRIQVTLSDVSRTMTDSSYALSCACLAKTCIQCLDVEEVTIISGSRTLTLREGMLLTYDEPFPDGTTTEETE